MTPPVILYNLLLIAVDAAALVAVNQARTTAAWLGVCAAAVAVAVALAIGLGGLVGRSTFAVLRLASHGLFLHGSVVLAGSALLLWWSQPRTAIGSALTSLLLVAVAIDAFWVEPTWLEVSHLRLATRKIGRALRIVVLADLQTDVIGSYERKVLRRALEEKPDLILLAGDYLHVKEEQWAQLRGQLNACLRELEFAAPAGVFAVRGNVDPDDWTEIFEGLPIVTVESTESFDLEHLRLTCLSRRDSFDPLLDVGLPDPGRFHVVLAHCPNYALGRIEADLLLAGHTHGGQVRLPLIGPLLTLSKVPRPWAAGLTELRNGARLFVSRGVGMERSGAPRMRLLCRPELAVIDLVPE